MTRSDDTDDAILELVLSGAPDRVALVLAAATAESRAELDATRAVLADYALALDPVAPSPGLRERIAAGLGARVEPKRRRALVVLDMIVDYLTPGRPLHVARARGIVPAVRARIDAARAAGDPVLFLVDEHEPHDPELEAWPLHAVKGTGGSDVIPELAPRPGDVVLPHRTYSAFFESELDAVLRGLGVTDITLTGCATEVGLLATATDALMRGFRVEVPPDAQAGTSEVGEQVALAVLSVMRPVEPMR